MNSLKKVRQTIFTIGWLCLEKPKTDSYWVLEIGKVVQGSEKIKKKKKL